MASSRHPAEALAEPKRPAVTRGYSGPGTVPKLTRRRVFFLLDSLNVGGTEVQAVELATRLSSERYEVTLGCLRARGPLLEKLKGSAVSVHEFYPKGGFDSIHGIYQMLRLAVFLRRRRFQIVHTHDLYSNVLGITAALLARVPVIISSQRDLAHLDLYRTKRKVWLRRLQKKSAILLTNANAVREAVMAENCFPPEKIRVIHNGVDLERYSQASRERAWLMPACAEEKWIVLVGSMYSDVKGHPWLISAAENIVREFDDARFLLVGDGVRRPEFERQVAQAGLEKYFHFLGRRDDVPRILGCCDIAVLPSKAEGLPNAVLEYLAAGLPTVASSVGGNLEVVQEGKTGLLVPPQDASALAEGILRLLRDPDFAAKLGRNGREFVSSEFTFFRLIENTDRLYTELLRSRGVE